MIGKKESNIELYNSMIRERYVPEKGIVKAKRIAKKTLTTVLLTFVGYIGTWKLTAALTPVVDSDIIQNNNYKPYTSFSKGYYNEHPLKICISDNFSTFSQFVMRKGLQYLDDNAKGIKFDIVIDDINKTDADVRVLNVQKDYDGECDFYTLGWTNVLSEKETSIHGDIMINTHTFHPYTEANTIIHEACHLIFRLKHSNNLNSIMYKTSSNIFLSKQDIENINTTVPPADEDDVCSAFTKNDATVSYVDYFKKLSKQKRNQSNNKDEMTID